MVSVPARRGQAAYATGRGLSATAGLHARPSRTVCPAVSIAEGGQERGGDGTDEELSAQYPRFGYRRVRIFLGRDGFAMSPGRAHRLWRVAKLQVPRKRPRKRIASSRPRPQTPVGPNQVWAFDFVFDACADGRQLKCLTVADEFTKEGLAIEVDGRIRSGRVIEVLSRLVSERGAPTSALRQRPGVRVARVAQMDRRSGHRHGVDRTRQALAEWRERKLQRQVPR